MAAFLPIPRTLGSFIILITILAFVAGRIRNELVLTLLGTVFLVLLLYCFLGVLLLGIVHRRKALSLAMTIISHTITAGESGELLIKNSEGISSIGKKRFWRLPAILVRCELNLRTGDGRVIRHYADPDTESRSFFPVKERGAYYGKNDSLIIFDAPGFFRLSLPVPGNESPRLLVCPKPAEETISLSPKFGGSERRREPHYRKSGELTDQRPYIPGDDPRLINWKLYSHTPMGELFIREGEPRPPPHSRLVILIDTELDRALYSLEEGRRAVDLLCENALAAAVEYSGKGVDIQIGFTGGEITGRKNPDSQDTSELTAALARPFAVFWPADSALPEAPEDSAVIVLALPRKLPPGTSVLDRFLKNGEQRADVIFIQGK